MGGVRGAASAFHLDLEHKSPKSNRNCRTPTSNCFTPRTPSTASQLLSIARDSCGKEEAVDNNNSMALKAETDSSYPRLLGRHPSTSVAWEGGQRRVHFNDDAQELAEGARAACLAMKQRIADRRLIKHA